MTYLLVLLIAGFAIAAAIALVRGLMAFHRDAQDERRNTGSESAGFGVQQNRMMAQRVYFQGTAIILIILVGVLAGKA